MHLIIASRADRASMAMANRLVGSGRFEPNGDGPDAYRYKDYTLKFIEKSHLHYDTLTDREKGITQEVRDIVFLSSHSSRAEIKSLTTHPTGNFGEAMLGGKERTLSTTSPSRMTAALKSLAASYGGDGFEITLESTHHGPCLDIPHYYLEIGTTQKEWNDEKALDAAFEAVFSEPERGAGNFVGIGGGHYMPKVTSYVMENQVNVGHLISKHYQDTITEGQIEEAVAKTPGCRGFIMDRKGCRGPVRAMIRDFADNHNLEIIKI